MRALTCFVCMMALWLTAAATAAQSTCLPASCGITVNEIEAYPTPQVRPLPVDPAILYDRDYRPVNGSLDIYSAPNGEIIETLDEGYTFLTIWEQRGDWLRIDETRWVHSSAVGESWSPSRFAGVELPLHPLPYTMAWTLRHLRGAETPGGPESNSNPFLYRYTRVNIYATVQIDGYSWYQIGVNQWVHQFKLAKIIPVERPATVDTHKWISVDLYEQVVIAYEGSTPVFATLVSSGLEEWPTNEGTFHVYVRFKRTKMSGAYNKPDFYYLQDVPWTMYYDNDIALHGAYWHDGFGYRKSHGCVNMTLTDAHWLFNWSETEYDFKAGDYTGPSVYVYSSGEYD